MAGERRRVDDRKPWDVYERDILPRLTAEKLYGGLRGLDTSGAIWTATCPFHPDDGRKLFIHPRWLSWHCTGGDGSGGAVQFLQKSRDCGWLDAAMLLARRAEIDPFVLEAGRATWTEAQFQRHAERERMYVLLEAFTSQARGLLHTKRGAPARAYLERRGFTADHLQAMEFGLHAGPDEVREFLVKQGFRDADAMKLGLLHAKWTGRVVGPWRDLLGRVVNVWGRVPGDPAAGQWKYENLVRPDSASPLGSKAVPLGLDRAKQAGKRHLLLVGGPLKALLPMALGLTDPHPVCTGGNLTDDQIETLSDYLGDDGSLVLNWDYDPFFQGGVQDRTLRTVERLQDAPFPVYVLDPQLLADPGDPYEGVDTDRFVLRSGDLQPLNRLLAERVHGFRYKAHAIVTRHRPGESWTDPALFAAFAEAEAFDHGISNPAKVSELEGFFWPEILRETHTRWETVQARRRSVEERQSRAREREAYESLLHDTLTLLRQEKTEEGKRFLWDRIDKLRADTSQEAGDPVLTLADELPRFDQYLSRRRGTEFLGLAMGTLPALDAALSGFRGLMVLAGPPGVGKSALAGQIGLDVVRHNPDTACLVVSLGMHRRRFTARMLGRLAGVSDRAMVLAAGADDTGAAESARRLREALTQLGEWGQRMKLLDSRNFAAPTLEKLATQVEEFKARTSTSRSLVVIDGLDAWPLASDPAAEGAANADAARLEALRRLCDAEGQDCVLAVMPLPPGTGPEHMHDGDLHDAWPAAALAAVGHLPDTVFVLGPRPTDRGLETAAFRSGQVRRLQLQILKGRDGVLRRGIDLDFHYPTHAFTEAVAGAQPDLGALEMEAFEPARDFEAEILAEINAERAAEPPPAASAPHGAVESVEHGFPGRDVTIDMKVNEPGGTGGDSLP